MSNNQPVIRVKNVSKTFKIPLDASNNLKQKFVNFYKRRSGYRSFKALDDITFDVREGDFFGIVGRNGSGKSTLLKILAGIYVPDQGRIDVNGTLMPFIELGVGFNNELSGRENVFLNGAMIGFSRKEMEAMYDEIVDFAELHDFMEEKIKNFSSGMKVRLAFSIAIRARSDILLLDEVLAVGDAAFKEKCNAFFKSQKGKRTIILVTHDMSSVVEYCNRAMFINDSKVVKIGESTEIAELYTDLFIREKQEKLKGLPKKTTAKELREELTLESVKVKQDDKFALRVKAHDDFQVIVEIHADRVYDNVAVGLKVFNSNGLWYMAASTRVNQVPTSLKKGKNTILFTIENVLTNDIYNINVLVKDDDRDGLLILQEAKTYEFRVEGIDGLVKSSLVHPKIKAKVN